MNYIVRDLMVPISEYATVFMGATLFEAVSALEEAQVNFDRSRYQHRAILVMDKNNRVVGKLSQLNVLCALGSEVDKKELKNINDLNDFGFSLRFISSMEARHRFAGRPFRGEYVDEMVPLETAIPQFLYGRHLSLLVTAKEGEIVGVLRLSDVFAAVFHIMEESRQQMQ